MGTGTVARCVNTHTHLLIESNHRNGYLLYDSTYRLLDYHTCPPYQPLSSQDSQPLATRAPSIDSPIKKGAATAACKNGIENDDREVSVPPLIHSPSPLRFFRRRSMYFPFGRSTPHYTRLPRTLIKFDTSKNVSHTFDNGYTLYRGSFNVYINRST